MRRSTLFLMNRLEGLPCPICQEPMERGVVATSGRGRLLWGDEPVNPLTMREGRSKNRLERLTTTKLPRLDDAVPAIRCGNCQVGAFDYRDA